MYVFYYNDVILMLDRVYLYTTFEVAVIIA